MSFNYGIDHLTVERAIAIGNGSLRAVINDAAIKKINTGAAWVQEIVSNDKTVYGINTGFGILSNTRISAADTAILQQKILQSHSVGVGNDVIPEIAKIMLITKIHALAQGYSGIQMKTLERIQWHAENNIIPVIPEKGSVGASGDLAPLAHLFLPLIGLGKCYANGQVQPTEKILKKSGLSPIQLGPKEGLALINGTQFILAYATQAVQRMRNCLDAADIIGAMSLEALTGTKAPFDPRLHALRPFAGNQLVAQRLRLLLNDSAIMQSHIDCGRLQ